MKNELVTLRDPEPTPELNAHSAILRDYVSPEARETVITTAQEAQIAADLLNDIKGRVAFLKSAQDYLTADFIRGIERVNALFQPAYVDAGAAVVLWTGKLKDYRRLADEQSRALLEHCRVAAAAGDHEASAAALAHFEGPARLAGISERKVWKVKVTEVDKIPRKFMCVDEGALRAYMREELKAGRTPKVNGVEFFQDEVIARTG